MHLYINQKRAEILLLIEFLLEAIYISNLIIRDEYVVCILYIKTCFAYTDYTP